MSEDTGARQVEESQWQRVAANTRLRVSGGWIYRNVALYESRSMDGIYHYHTRVLAMVFVPDPPAHPEER